MGGASPLPSLLLSPHCHSESVLKLVVAIRPRAPRRGTPKPPLCKGRCHGEAVTEGLSKGTFRAPARGTFALGGKSTQKRRSNLRFENPLRGFTCCLSCLFSPRERCAMQISPKSCIVSAPLFAAAFALKCKAVQCCISTQRHYQPAAKGRHQPLPLRGKGAI